MAFLSILFSNVYAGSYLSVTLPVFIAETYFNVINIISAKQK